MVVSLQKDKRLKRSKEILFYESLVVFFLFILMMSCSSATSDTPDVTHFKLAKTELSADIEPNSEYIPVQSIAGFQNQASTLNIGDETILYSAIKAKSGVCGPYPAPCFIADEAGRGYVDGNESKTIASKHQSGSKVSSEIGRTHLAKDQSGGFKIKHGQAHLFYFNANVGKFLNVSPVADKTGDGGDELDLKLELKTVYIQDKDVHRDGGIIVEQNDNGGIGVNPLIEDYRLVTGTRYKLSVTSHGKYEGSFQMSVMLSDEPLHKSDDSFIWLITTIVILLILLVLSLCFAFWSRVDFARTVSIEPEYQELGQRNDDRT